MIKDSFRNVDNKKKAPKEFPLELFENILEILFDHERYSSN